jgi:poly-gamma-glutamate synthesis protein (capsule biosynthesis protein)
MLIMKKRLFLCLLFLLFSRPPVVSNHELTISPDQTVVIRFGGDCLLAGYYEDSAGDSVNLAFSGFDLLESADIAMVNLECPVTTRGQRVQKPYNFRMHPRFLSALTSAGVDVVNIANNHIFDYGTVGLFDTISYLDSVGMHHVGAGRNAKQARAPVILSVNGKRVALLGYYGGGEAPKATASKPGVADRRIDVIRSDIEKLRRQNAADYIVVNFHWGTEKAETPDQDQVEFAHEIIDAGADLIIGHHPHVLQGIEKYKAGTIAYSLGNFVFGGNSRDTYDTALFEVRLGDQGPAFRLIPIRIDKWRAKELSGAEADKVIERVQELSTGFPESIFTH